MIFLVTAQTKLFECNEYKTINVEESLAILNKCEVLQYDSETTGRDAHICDILCIQFGSDKYDFQMVIDCTSIDIMRYKNILEDKFLIGQNLKFDVQFLYCKNIIPRRVYDTMIVEQLLYLGYPSGIISYSLAAIAKRRLNTDIDKTIRGQIIWRGLDTEVIIYAAYDVKYLELIMKSQIIDCQKKGCMVGAKLECDFVPTISYLEWCGIKLDVNRWKSKMKEDKIGLEESKKALDNFIISNNMSKYYKIDRQGDLFSGFNTEPQCTINWDSSKQVINIAKLLGFDTKTVDKKTGEDKDTVIEKELKRQKGIDDEFLKLYFDFKGASKVVSSFGQGHLNAINPKTERIHTVFRQLGAASGRMSSGSNQPNTDLAKFKKLKPSEVKYPNLQQLPADEPTRSSFVAGKGNLFVSCDFSAEESRLGADIYNDKAFRDEFLYGSKDTHNMFAWVVFRKECEACGCTSVSEVKAKAPQWRKKVKAVEFAYMFGAAAPTIATSANCSVEQAQAYIDALDKEFIGMSSFAKKGAMLVRKNGYILINPITGHKLYWWDHDQWLERQKNFTQEFWEEYREYHKGTNDSVAQEVRMHFQAAGKYDRLARNACTQGTGAIILKEATINLFNWIVDNGYFGKIRMCVFVHDEINCEFPEELKDTFPNILQDFMEKAAAKYCKSVPIPAVPEVSDHWIH